MNSPSEVSLASTDLSQIRQAVIAGWAGRDRAAVQAHIDELAALGVAPPRQVPTFYRVAAANLTTADHIEVAGRGSTGEVEMVLLSLADGLWLAAGSDHTDRVVEAVGVTFSKQICAKPVSRTMWRLDDVAGHIDELVLRSWVVRDGERIPYQEGKASALLPPAALVDRCWPGSGMPAGTAMFCGTLSVHGPIEFADRFELELHDPVLGRSLHHGYQIAALPVEP